MGGAYIHGQGYEFSGRGFAKIWAHRTKGPKFFGVSQDFGHFWAEDRNFLTGFRKNCEIWGRNPEKFFGV